MSSRPRFTVKVSAPASGGKGVSIDDFVSYMPTHSYVFMPTAELWRAASVNARLAPMPKHNASGTQQRDKNGKPLYMPASAWLDQNRPVEQITWSPGDPKIIHDRLISDGGWIDRKDVMLFNQYRPPCLKLGNAAAATPWIAHAYKVFGDDAEHTIRWLAHRVQRPQEKINHGLVLGGEQQGTGKDTLLEPVRPAVGPWNFKDISPDKFLGRFNGFAKAVVLRVNEARDRGESDRFKFYDHSKPYTAAPPATLHVDEKHLREYWVPNCLGFIITTNHRDSVFLLAEDRRHFVAWSNQRMKDYPEGYWERLWGWYEREGGYGHVAAYLAGLDLSAFDPKAPPPKTAAFWDIVNLNTAPEDHDLADVIDAMGSPDALTLKQLMAKATGAVTEWLLDGKNARMLKHRLSRCKYVAVRNPDREDGRWRINGMKETVYAKSSLSPQERERAARELQG
jgi:hypothetical protein